MKTEVTIEKLKEFISSIEKERIPYIVIAGFDIDGKRGYISRPHQDLDILCLKKDLSKLQNIVGNLGYSGEFYNNLYKLHRDDGSKIDLALLEKEGEYAVSDGRLATTKFPFELFEHPQRGKIDDFEFNIAPNELLKTWGSQAPKGNDAEYVKDFIVDSELMNKINRTLK
jgi:hypothetical protein